ncbi:MAG: DUF2007 domain-containing protein [Muribaculaceae bacterium]|nr:DUF2007 domain-containing protein [Muribaculaceae bacterium]
MEIVAQFSNEPDAFLAKARLAANEIAAWVEPNTMATLYGAGATWAPINLYVRNEDIERALKVLSSNTDEKIVD